MKNVINKIKETTKERMDKWEIDFFNFIKELDQYCTYDVYKEESVKELKNSKGYEQGNQISYLKMRNGYQKSYQRFFGRSDDNLKAMISKEANAKLNKIETAVYKKLKGFNVESVELINFQENSITGHSEGSWKLNDEKIFSFKSIYAGGYNIQCEHVRTLYKFK